MSGSLGPYRYRFHSDKRSGGAQGPVERTMRAEVRLWSGAAAWYFALLPVSEARSIKREHGVHARGWGSLPVIARVGEVEWRTSIFPDGKSGTYLLPLKADVRRRAGIKRGDRIELGLRVRP
ncbi:MAG: hypothetical protein MOGMAGMI_01450 [Candidatus Omnitrophica bacterium]|nr:hypothetical protein [Candidatus Omnitrophota bacterium]